MLQHSVKKAIGLIRQPQTPPPRVERPRELRVPTDLKVNWTWGGAEHGGVLKNISACGCFILAENEVRVGDQMQLELTIPGMLTIPIMGLVARVRGGEGFALRFRGLSGTAAVLLKLSLWHLSSILEHNRPILERINEVPSHRVSGAHLRLRTGDQKRVA